MDSDINVMMMEPYQFDERMFDLWLSGLNEEESITHILQKNKYHPDPELKSLLLQYAVNCITYHDF
jgi:hypothetical protein